MVQYPAEQGEVAIVMRSAEGTGKGILACAMMRILGQNALHISNAKHLVGSFNAHLRDCVFLFADEAFYAGDKAHVGVIRSLITEPYLTIEGKYQNAVQTSNFLHLMMAGNEPWVVPASPEARRYRVLEVGEAHNDDHAHFAAIRGGMEAGGYEAMLHDLLQIDLTTFNLRRVPVTDRLQQQKKLSLDTSNAWWLEVSTEAMYSGHDGASRRTSACGTRKSQPSCARPAMQTSPKNGGSGIHSGARCSVSSWSVSAPSLFAPGT
jgi:hypothetical protein